MLKHIVIWKLKDELTEEQKKLVKADIKAGIEALKEKLDTVISVKVEISPLDSSNTDIMLESSFKDAENLKKYAIHPLHLEIINTKILPNVKDRICFDYEI